jgi:hypothetical protein
MKSPLLQANSQSPQSNYELRGRYQHANESGPTRPDSLAQRYQTEMTMNPLILKSTDHTKDCFFILNGSNGDRRFFTVTIILV